MAKLTKHIIEVEAIDERDYDRQADNLLKIKGAEELDFRQGWFGSPSTFVVTFKADGFNLQESLDACDKAVSRARKVKSNDDSQIERDEFDRVNARMKANAKPMRIYFTAVKE